MKRILRLTIMITLLLALATSVEGVTAGRGDAVAFVRTPTDTFAWQTQPPELVFNDIQAAIDHVFGLGGGQVRIAKGVYTPSDKGGHFALRNGVLVSGGFAGDESGDIPMWRSSTVPEQQTVLRPNGGHIFKHVEEDTLGETAVLENVTLTGARGFSAVSNSGAHPTFVNVIFSDNEAENGAAMHNFFSNPTIIEAMFHNNRASLGGGAINNVSSSPTVRDSEFASNSSQGAGGAILNSSSRPTFNGATFVENEAGHDGGALAAINDSHVLFYNSRFSRNKSKRYGGALSAEGGVMSMFNANFSGNIGLFGGAKYLSHAYSNSVNASFFGNSAKHGGAAYADNSEVGYINTYFFRNSSEVNGGAIYGNLAQFRTFNTHLLENRAQGRGGGLYNSGGSLLAVNTLFVLNNGDDDGGALYSTSATNADSRLEVINSTIVNNTSRGNGGGVATADYFVAVRNSIISGNTGENVSARGLSPTQTASAVLRNTIVGSRFYDRESVSDEVAFDADKHLNREFRPIGEDNPAIGTGDNSVFTEVFSNLNIQFGAGRMLRAYDLHGGDRIANGETIDLGALQSSASVAEISAPMPVISARTALGQTAAATRVASSVYLTAYVDVTDMDNFPFVRRNGFMPFEIYIEDKYGQELYSGTKIEYNSGEYNFWSSLPGAAESARAQVMLEIERSGPRVTTVSFGEGVEFSSVPIDISRVEITFASDVRSSGQSTRVRLFTIESEGDGRERELELANLSDSLIILSNRLIVDLSAAKLRYGAKYRLQIEGLVDGLNNRMDTFSADFVTQVSPEVREPVITGLLAAEATFSSDGGFADIIVAGGNLSGFSDIFVTFNDNSGRASVSTCGTFATAGGIFIPPNAGDNPISYTFGVTGDDVDKSQQLTITVDGRLTRTADSFIAAPVFSTDVPKMEYSVTHGIEMIANGLPVRTDDFNTIDTLYIMPINSVGGEATVVIAYSELERMKELNPHFRLGIASPLGMIKIPADTSRVVRGMQETISNSGMSNNEIYLRYRLENVPHSESITDFNSKNLSGFHSKNLSGFRLDGSLVRLSLEVVGGNGKVLKDVTDFVSNMQLLLPVSVGGVLSTYSSVYMVTHGTQPTFVPNTLTEQGGIRYVAVNAPGTGSFFVGESLVDFADIAGYSTYREMRQAAALGIIRGMGDGNFEPARLVTRGEFFQMAASALNLGSSAQEAPFADVSRDGWYSSSISSMYEAGLLTAFAGNTLEPHKPITREEAASVIGAVLMRSPKAITDFAPLRTTMASENFRDASDIATPFQRDALLVTRLGIMLGRHDSFLPKGSMTREDAAVALIRMMRVIDYII